MATPQIRHWKTFPGAFLVGPGGNDNDTAYFAAGRNSFLDGGIAVFGLEQITGEVLLNPLAPGTGDPLVFLGKNPGDKASPITPLTEEHGNRVPNFFGGAVAAHKRYNDFQFDAEVLSQYPEQTKLQ